MLVQSNDFSLFFIIAVMLVLLVLHQEPGVQLRPNERHQHSVQKPWARQPQYWQKPPQIQRLRGDAYMLKTHYRRGHHPVSNFEVENIVNIHMKLKFLWSAPYQAVFIYSIRPDNGPDIFKDSRRPTAAVPRLSEDCFEVICKKSCGSEDQQQQDAAEPTQLQMNPHQELDMFSLCTC